MKLCFFKRFLCGVALTLVVGGLANAEIVPIDFTTSFNSPATTGDLLDNQFSLGDAPETFDVVEDTTLGLTITIESITSNSTTGASIEAANASFGITGGSFSSAGDTQLNAAGDESITFSFNQDVVFVSAFFSSFTSADEIDFGGVTITEALSTDDVFSFTGANSLALAANTPITIEADASNFGLATITVDVAAVPEPSSLALLGLLGLEQSLVADDRTMDN